MLLFAPAAPLITKTTDMTSTVIEHVTKSERDTRRQKMTAREASADGDRATVTATEAELRGREEKFNTHRDAVRTHKWALQSAKAQRETTSLRT